MSDLQPKGEKLRKAVRWISEQLEADPERALGALVSDATLRFDLNPKEGEFLLGFYRDRKPAAPEE